MHYTELLKQIQHSRGPWNELVSTHLSWNYISQHSLCAQFPVTVRGAGATRDICLRFGRQRCNSCCLLLSAPEDSVGHVGCLCWLTGWCGQHPGLQGL